MIGAAFRVPAVAVTVLAALAALGWWDGCRARAASEAVANARALEASGVVRREERARTDRVVANLAEVTRRALEGRRAALADADSAEAEADTLRQQREAIALPAETPNACRPFRARLTLCELELAARDRQITSLTVAVDSGRSARTADSTALDTMAVDRDAERARADSLERAMTALTRALRPPRLTVYGALGGGIAGDTAVVLGRAGAVLRIHGPWALQLEAEQRLAPPSGRTLFAGARRELRLF